MTGEKPDNTAVAELLNQIADLLETQDANPFRVRAYRKGARTVRETDKDIGDRKSVV